MHTNQIDAFRDISESRNTLIRQPFHFDGQTYATDGRTIIRWPELMDGFTRFDETTDKGKTFVAALRKNYEFFDLPTTADLARIPMTTLALDPIVERQMMHDAPSDMNNPHLDEAGEVYRVNATFCAIHARTVDARRLLFIRQHLPDAAYIDQPAATFDEPLRFVFGEGRGQGAVMPLNTKGGGVLHWNGMRYFSGW